MYCCRGFRLHWPDAGRIRRSRNDGPVCARSILISNLWGLFAMTTSKSARWLMLGGGLVALAVLLWFATRPPPLSVQGEVSANRVDISPRVAGRVIKLPVNVGDVIEKGALLAELESPQLVAALAAARAALGVAKADLDRVNSTRPETIAARKADVA